MNFLNLLRPENVLKPTAGKLLIAEPFLKDSNFSRTVVLLCEHGEEGSVGFILNHLTDITLEELLPELYPAKADIYDGGPVQTDTLHMLHSLPDVLGGNEIGQGIYWGGSYEVLQEMLHDNLYDPSRIRLFVGYSGWSLGQLDKELEEGSWFVADIPDNLLFATKPENVWKEAISYLGKDYKYIANMPINPQLN
jgi:putative transcriptional regulator